MFGVDTLVLLLWIGLGKFVTIAVVQLIADSPHGRSRRVFNVAIEDPNQARREFRSPWLLTTDAIALAILMALGWIKIGPDRVANVLLTAAFLFVWIEIWFYFSHRAMHASNYLWRFHNHHHLSVVLRPMSAASFSIVEKAFFYTTAWVGSLLVLSWWMPISLLGVALYYTIYYISSSGAHSNTELLPAFMHKLPFGLGRILGSSTAHALHHVRYRGNYGFLTSVLDRIFGTYIPSTDELFQRAIAGDGPTVLPGQKI